MNFIIVTGAGGFLGSHIAAVHLTMGDFVLGFDNWCSSSPNSKHVKRLRQHTNCVLVDCDITKRDPMEAYIDAVRALSHMTEPVIIYNFACPASPPRYQAMPIETMMTCVVGTKNVLELAWCCGATVVHASTSEIYGDPSQTPQVESYRGYVNSFGPRACYDEGKRAAEALCYDYLNKYKVDVRPMRIFNTYGPNMDPDDGRVISNFINQALRGENLTIYGDGKQTRSFCYVSDLVSGAVTLGTLEKNPSLNQPINVGNPHEFTILELAEKVASHFPGIKIVHEPLPTDDPKQRKPDIALATTLLNNWQPQVQLDKGLGQTIFYFRSLHNA